MNSEMITGDNGTYFLNNTTAHTGLRLQAIQINEDAVFTTLTITERSTGNTYSALAVVSGSNLYGQNLSGRTVKAGILLTAPVGNYTGVVTAPPGGYFSAVTMSSGSAIGIKTVL